MRTVITAAVAFGTLVSVAFGAESPEPPRVIPVEILVGHDWHPLPDGVAHLEGGRDALTHAAARVSRCLDPALT